jgi:glycosidase
VARAKLAATLLLTLPGLPFIYYGEELGMTGDKPDPRIRTPMPWAIGPAAGFTTGLPWEPLHPDSLVANVAAQAHDPGSLLAHYRALIHLRAESAALGAGRLVPLEAGTDDVAAWLRVEGEQVALVVANLGEEPREAVRVSSRPGVLAPGTWRTAPRLGEATPARFEVGPDGRIAELVPALTLPPLAALVFELASAGAR